MTPGLEAKDSVSTKPVFFRRDKLVPFPATSNGEVPQSKQVDGLNTGLVLLQSAGLGVYGLDLNGFVTFVNPAARRMTGWTQEDLEGRTQHSMVHHSHADGRNYPREECPIYMAFHDGRTHCREDEVFWRKDGSSFPVEYTSTPVFVDGELTGAVVVFSDITDRTRRRDWDGARIDILKGILRGRSLEDTTNALCDAFAAFQRGCQISLCRALPDEDQGNVEAVGEAAPHTVTRAVRNAAGTRIGIIRITCGSRLLESQEGLSALAEIDLLFAAALTHSS